MNYRAFLIRAVTFLGGIYFFLKFLLPDDVGGVRFGAYDEQISDGFVLVGVMAVALGLINLLMVHGSKVAFRRRGWVTSLALLFGLAAMLTVSGLDWLRSREIARAVQPLGMLRAFSERIASDHAAGVTPEGIFHGERRKLLVHERNILLAEAVNRELSLIDAVSNRVMPRLATLAADSPAHFALKRVLTELGDAETMVRQQLQQLSITPLAASTQSGADLSANSALTGSLSALAVSYRSILTAEYKGTLTKRFYDFLFEGLYISLGAAMFSLLGFYIGAAAYRAFRVRSAESVLMMAAAFIVMLGQIPFGYWLWSGLPELRLWLLQVPSAAAARAVELGAAVAGLVMAFRMWLSIESESFK